MCFTGMDTLEMVVITEKIFTKINRCTAQVKAYTENILWPFSINYTSHFYKQNKRWNTFLHFSGCFFFIILVSW